MKDLKKAITALTAFAGLVTSLGTHAGGQAPAATIIRPAAATDGINDVYFLYVDKDATGTPSCATYTRSDRRFAIDPATDIGRAMIATALAARMAGLKINISGTGNCLIWGDTESIAWLDIMS